MIAINITTDTVNGVVGATPFCLSRHTLQGEQLVAAFRRGANEDEIRSLLAFSGALRSWAGGDLVLQPDGKVLYKGEVLPASLGQRVVDCAEHSIPFSWLIAFFGNLANNPSNRAVEELHRFLENRNMPIDERGCFVGYKAIRNNWMDKHSGTIRNCIGDSPFMKRREVDDDARQECSYGLHVGSLEYVKSFANNYGSPGGDRIVLVSVNPADVVSVPYADAQKLRTCRYTVLAEYTGPLPDGGIRTASQDEDTWDEDDDLGVDFNVQETQELTPERLHDLVLEHAGNEEGLLALLRQAGLVK